MRIDERRQHWWAGTVEIEACGDLKSKLNLQIPLKLRKQARGVCIVA